MRTMVVVAGLLLLAIGPGVSEAEAQRSADERARFHFEAGRSYFDEGNYERALEEWQRSYDLSQRPALLLNLATTYERLARYGDAADTLERYLATAEEVPNRDVMQRRIANLRERAASEPPPSTTATEPAPPTGTPTTEPAATTPPPADTETTPPPVAPPRDEGAAIPVGTWVSWGIGAAGLVTFAVVGALALSEESDVADGCGATRTCTDDDLDPIDTKALIADIGLGVAVVGAAVGTVLLLTSGGGSEEASVAFAPVVGPTMGGLAAEGRF